MSTIVGLGTLSGVIGLTDSPRLSGQLSIAIAPYNDYEGVYEVIPTAQDQMLITDNCLLLENVTVKAIPYREVENLYGTTVYIG